MAVLATAYLERYEHKIAPARERFLARLAPFFQEVDRRVLGLFLIHFCAQGVGMTDAVPDWIRRAGENTRKKGFEELGSALIAHAAHEAGHHELMIDDTRSLVGWWNERFSPTLNADEFLSLRWGPGVQAYRKMHEDYIAGDTPFCQIAIEYEIEKVSVEYGPKLFGHLLQHVGHEILGCLSFITEHVAVDAGHTNYNARALGEFVGQAPNTVEALVRAGGEALHSYAGYLDDCLKLARSRT